MRYFIDYDYKGNLDFLINYFGLDFTCKKNKRLDDLCISADQVACTNKRVNQLTWKLIYLKDDLNIAGLFESIKNFILSGMVLKQILGGDTQCM